MFKQNQFHSWLILVIILNLLIGCRKDETVGIRESQPITRVPVEIETIEENKELTPEENQEKDLKETCFGKNRNSSITFIKTNNLGERYEKGINHVIIFNPKSDELDFKVNVALSHKIYSKTNNGKIKKEYVPKLFYELVNEENAKLNGRLPLAAINADYIDTENRPQGLNISRGVEYSGAFKNKRSSFGISGGKPSQRKATIKVGRRNSESLNYNVVGGNGRFYINGKFKDICRALGELACKGAINRSMAAITNKGYVILLVNDAKANSSIEISSSNRELLPHMFDDVLEGIAQNNCLGKIQEGMLFDGGMSPGLYYNNKVYLENLGPIGSVFLIYRRNS